MANINPKDAQDFEDTQDGEDADDEQDREDAEGTRRGVDGPSAEIVDWGYESVAALLDAWQDTTFENRGEYQPEGRPGLEGRR